MEQLEMLHQGSLKTLIAGQVIEVAIAHEKRKGYKWDNYTKSNYIIEMTAPDYMLCKSENDPYTFLKISAEDFLSGFICITKIIKDINSMNGLQKLMNQISEWSDKQFGTLHRNPAIIYHLKKEVDELIEEIEKTNYIGSDDSIGVGEFGRQLDTTKMEYADCFILLLDSAKHFGLTASEIGEIISQKLEINKKRTWGKPDINGVCEHVK